MSESGPYHVTVNTDPPWTPLRLDDAGRVVPGTGNPAAPYYTAPSTLPTDAERAQARAEHLDAVADCFELGRDGDRPVVRVEIVNLLHLLPHQERGCLPDLDEARAIRDRLAELIEDAETGGAV